MPTLPFGNCLISAYPVKIGGVGGVCLLLRTLQSEQRISIGHANYTDPS